MELAKYSDAVTGLSISALLGIALLLRLFW